MNKFVRNLITEWRKLDLPFANEKVLVAVSGGADSVSLALALHKLSELKKFQLEFVIAHFNHKLRGTESEADEKFVEELAAKLDFEFISGEPKIKIQNEKGNLEQLARNARYDFLMETSEKINAPFILTAHTLNDQAETFLFNLLRGSGIDGLSAMKSKRVLESETKLKFKIQNSKLKIELVRPLLNWAKREDTEKFCMENNIIFREDAMNEDIKFSRVRIRKELIPILQKFNPQIIETLAKTANLLRNETELPAKVEFKIEEILAVKELKLLTKSRRLRYLRDWIKIRRGSLRQIESVHLEAVENLIVSRKSGRIIELPGGGRIIKGGGKLSFEINKVEKRRRAN